MTRILCVMFPNLPIADPADNVALLRKLARWAQRYSPWVGIDQEERPDRRLAGTRGCAHLFGGEQALAADMLKELASQGLVARAAVADTLGAAWAAAHFPPSAQSGASPGTPQASPNPGADALRLASKRELKRELWR